MERILVGATVEGMAALMGLTTVVAIALQTERILVGATVEGMAALMDLTTAF